MTWFTPITLTRDEPCSPSSLDSWAAWPATGSLGSAVAGGWSWDGARPSPRPAAPSSRLASTYASAFAPAGVRLRAPRNILARMAGAAGALGRSESDIWIEAAREWLSRHEPESSGGGGSRFAPALTPADGQWARRSRAWRDIDGVLADLRDAPRSTSDVPGVA